MSPRNHEYSKHPRAAEAALDEAELQRHAQEFQNTAQAIRGTHPYLTALSNGATASEAFTSTARTIVEAKRADKNLGTSERAAVDGLDVLSRLGGFVQAQQENDAINDQEELSRHSLTHEERQRRKQLKNEHLIPFNHSLKSYIDTHPDDDLRATAAALAATYSTQMSLDNYLGDNQRIPTIPDADDISRYIETALRGMRNELAAETILVAAGYDYDYHVSTEEDAAGADMYIRTNEDEPWEPLDVKASLSAANRDRMRAREYGYFSNAVWTGLHDDNYTGRKGNKPGALSISFETAVDKAGSFTRAIEDMRKKRRQFARMR